MADAVSRLDQFVAGFDGFARLGEVADGRRVVRRIDHRRRESHQLGEVGRRRVSLERHRIGDPAALDQLAAGCVQLAMRGVVEVLGLEDARDVVVGAIVQQDRAEHALFRLDVVGRLPGRRRAVEGHEVGGHAARARTR